GGRKASGRLAPRATAGSGDEPSELHDQQRVGGGRGGEQGVTRDGQAGGSRRDRSRSVRDSAGAAQGREGVADDGRRADRLLGAAVREVARAPYSGGAEQGTVSRIRQGAKPYSRVSLQSVSGASPVRDGPSAATRHAQWSRLRSMTHAL